MYAEEAIYCETGQEPAQDQVQNPWRYLALRVIQQAQEESAGMVACTTKEHRDISGFVEDAREFLTQPSEAREFWAALAEVPEAWLPELVTDAAGS